MNFYYPLMGAPRNQGVFDLVPRFLRDITPRVIIPVLLFMLLLDYLDGPPNMEHRVHSYNFTSGNESPPVIFSVTTCDKNSESASASRVVTLMKSVVISARLYGIDNLEFHIIMEKNITEFLMKDALAWKLDNPNWPSVQISFYDFTSGIPLNFWFSIWWSKVYTKDNLCSVFGRLLTPAILPHVESVIDLRPDSIVTGSIERIWSIFNKMTDQHILSVYRSEVSSKWIWKYLSSSNFTYDASHTGIMLMNLTRMRESRWLNKIYKTMMFCDDFNLGCVRKNGFLTNVLLSMNKGSLHHLECQFNLFSSDCHCQALKEDTFGVQVIHFESEIERERLDDPFNIVYEIYSQFDMGEEDVKQGLMLPLRQGCARQQGINIYFKVLSTKLFKNVFMKCTRQNVWWI